MSESLKGPTTPEETLTRAFFQNYPRDAARKIETLFPEDAALLLCDQPLAILKPVLAHLSAGVLDNVLLHCEREHVLPFLQALEPGPCAALLNRLEEETRNDFLSLLDPKIAAELRELMDYPEDTAGSLMEPDILAFHESITVKEARRQLRNHQASDLHHLYLVNDANLLHGLVPVLRFALADGKTRLADIASPIPAYATALDPIHEVMETMEKYQLDSLPVLDGNDQFIGLIREKNFLGALKETLGTEMQTMVGASKDERALSSSWFAVKKRLPWLQINLFTAFLAAAVVGIFESTIAKYTALAILLPIAAGQSGNTGAQALAVTMRGLTLREITVRHWPRVVFKEAGAALINGLAIALTCGIGVYFWSNSQGLALIIALAMISSMIIASVSGAMVPILLQKMGQDPALSSSIILTTVTDIAGFMSFLGIATMLSGMLEVG